MESKSTHRKRRLSPKPSDHRRPKSSADFGHSAVDDGEVEEFFAILRRLHDARSRRHQPHVPTTRWNPSFVWEDFADPSADAAETAESAPARIFDLNEPAEIGDEKAVTSPP